MPCPRHASLSAYADQAMQPRARARFERHLHACPICQQHLDELHALTRGLRAMPSPTLNFDLAAQLADRLPRTPRRNRRAWPALWQPSAWLPTGVAAGLALLSGVWMGGLLLGGGTVGTAVPAPMVRVFDPVPPGGLCAAAELCRPTKGML
ncbi:MAG: anti-sigma factor [Acidovorax sp. SCN 65-28]|nr:MAG: anti-sigma factor [Acidovorax sp. SCN 65-28]